MKNCLSAVFVATISHSLMRGGTADEFCARSYQLANDICCDNEPTGIYSYMSSEDPIKCIEEPGYFYRDKHSYSYSQWSECTEEIWQTVPTGRDETAAINCTVFFDPFLDRNYTLSCYYNVLTNEFCGSVLDHRGYECADVDKGASIHFQSDCEEVYPYGCTKFRRLVKRGSCEEPAVFPPQLAEPDDLTDEFVNARNVRLNEDNACSISTLANSRAADTRIATVSIETCHYAGITALERCYSSRSYMLTGQQVSLIGAGADVIAQRQDGNNVCFAWEYEETNTGSFGTRRTKECREACVAAGASRRIRTWVRNVYPTSITSENLVLTVSLGAEDSASGDNDDRGDPEDGGGSDGRSGSGGSSLFLDGYAVTAALLMASVMSNL